MYFRICFPKLIDFLPNVKVRVASKILKQIHCLPEHKPGKNFDRWYNAKWGQPFLLLYLLSISCKPEIHISTILTLLSTEIPKQVLWQAVKTEMKCRIRRHFIRVCTVCKVSTVPVVQLKLQNITFLNATFSAPLSAIHFLYALNTYFINFNLFENGNPLRGTLANSEYSDEMQHNAAFYQGLHCLQIL